MTDRVISLVVALDREYRTDDAEHIVNAIKMVKGVENATFNIFTNADQMNAWSAKQNYFREFMKYLFDRFEKEMKA